MPSNNLFRTTVFRLTAIYVVAFAVALAALGSITYVVTERMLERQLDRRIQNESSTLETAYRSGGLARLVGDVNSRSRSRPNGPLDHAVLESGKRIAGHLSTWPTAPGWSTMRYSEGDGEVGQRRVLLTDLGQGRQLAVAADPEQLDEVTQAIFNGSLSAFGAVLVLGVLGGIGLSLALIKRVEAIRRTAEAIVEGDLSRRVPIRGSGDDFDLLSQTLNRMLDRIADLMNSLREVSANIAHDLKTPLARLRKRLEQARDLPHHAQTSALDAAIVQVDDILSTFSALLRIAQIEAGTRRSGFADVDLSDMFETVAEAFAPAVDDAGKTFASNIEPGIHIFGDRELLTQMLVNIVENAIRHTPPGTKVDLALGRDGTAIVGSVTDNGAGIESAERERIFQRFYRLDGKRSVPGSGLGLSLVKAVADIHGATVDARDARPGVSIVIRFPDRPAERKAVGRIAEQ